MNTVGRMKNGQYDVHLDLYTMLFMKNLLKKWVECTKSSPFSNIKQSELLEQMEAALNLPKDVDKLFQEKITSEQISVLEKENEELKKDKEYLDNINNEQTKVILQLNEQIEKMKCCENCKKMETCKLFAHIDIRVCDKWELAK